MSDELLNIASAKSAVVLAADEVRGGAKASPSYYVVKYLLDLKVGAQLAARRASHSPLTSLRAMRSP